MLRCGSRHTTASGWNNCVLHHATRVVKRAGPDQRRRTGGKRCRGTSCAMTWRMPARPSGACQRGHQHGGCAGLGRHARAQGHGRSAARQVPQAKALMDAAENDVLAFMIFRRANWTQIYFQAPRQPYEQVHRSAQRVLWAARASPTPPLPRRKASSHATCCTPECAGCARTAGVCCAARPGRNQCSPCCARWTACLAPSAPWYRLGRLSSPVR
jgi:hypothetical protein